MHTERLIEQLKAEVVSLRTDIAISKQLDEIKNLLVEIRERLLTTEEEQKEIAALTDTVRTTADELQSAIAESAVTEAK